MEKVLTVRQSEEDVAKKGFLEKKALQMAEESKLEHFKKASHEMKHNTQNFSNINSLRMQYLYQNFLDEQIVLQAKEVEKINQQVIEELDVLLDKQKNRKMIEKLKEKQLASYQEQYKKEEQKELDEMGTLRFGANYY